ncbi:MAG: iron-hydroxamate transporter ATP-binding subunit [Chlorobi bacterium]|jgi:iron complex transport system ATP-binding protein|nr:iron-hydroxamate transporter ATP-binding subunit [Chlorobiota bacterium]
MALSAHDITFSYGPRFALRVDTMTADAGELVGIIGANGSGKTTLLKILCGLRPAATGTILLDGMPLEGYSALARARHLTYVPQSHRPAFEFTVEQTVLLGRVPYRGLYGGFEREEDLGAAERAMELMELDALRNEQITSLSGGELQRVMLARALAQDAGTLLLDEPNSHLDIAHQQSVLATIREQVKQRSICAIASIHDLNLASMFCDRIIAMAGGRVVGQGRPAEVLTATILRQTFGTELVVEPGAYGDAPAIRYTYRMAEDANA